MPKRADGPSTGGYQYGSFNAFRANLPAKAINPRGHVSEADAQARKMLNDFAAYPARAKSIGKPLPATRGISKRRAAALQKSRTPQADQYRYVVIDRNDDRILKLGRCGRFFRFLEEHKTYSKLSLVYGSKDRALAYYRIGRISWVSVFEY
jgi:hypothetical protein